MNLISKKDLLALTGISYGQLYRWKRQRLIPDEWFIKRSSYTGQETFFPREQILSRVQSILELKDEYSLEELAKVLSPENFDALIPDARLKELQEIDASLLDQISEMRGKNNYNFEKIALLVGISEALCTPEVPQERVAKLICRSMATLDQMHHPPALCTVFIAGKKYRTAFSQDSLVLDNSMEIIAEIALAEIINRLQVKYKNELLNQ